MIGEAIFVRADGNYDMHAASIESGLACDPASGMTKQSFAEEVDINTIVKRFGLSGQLPDDFRVPSYGDFSDVIDFKTAMDVVSASRENFESLPAAIRSRFENDPQKFLEFVSDEDNREEMRKMGLLKEGSVTLAAAPAAATAAAAATAGAVASPVTT